MNSCTKDALPKTTLKLYDSLLFHYKILFETLSDVRKSVAAKLICWSFTSPAHLGANKTHHSVWRLSFEFSSVITKLLPKVLSVLVLPQRIPILSGKCRAAAKKIRVDHMLRVVWRYFISIFFKCSSHKPAFWPQKSRLRLFRNAPFPAAFSQPNSR